MRKSINYLVAVFIGLIFGIIASPLFQLNLSKLSEISEIVLGVAAILVAFLALITSKQTLRQNITHNKKSVEPSITLSCKFPVNESIEISTINKGLGPGLITGIKFIINDEEINLINKRSINSYLESAGLVEFEIENQKMIHNIGFDFSLPIYPEPFLPGELHRLIVFNNPFRSTVLNTRLLEILGRTKIVIDYESFYGEKRSFADNIHETDNN